LRDVINGILRQLLTVNLQRRYNWYGQKGKLPFGKLKIANLVCSKLFDFTLLYMCKGRKLYL
jgi:hypothetical protein